MEIVGTIFTLSLYGAIAWLIVSWAFNRAMTRISPKYAAKRQLKQQAELDRQRDKRLKREANQKARLYTWAKAHPNDPAAKAILAEESLSPAASPEDAEPDGLKALRESQKAADDYERRREDRKVAERLRSQQMLDWALANPASPEGRRHLEETLLEVNQRIMSADNNIAFASYATGSDVPEAIATATRVAELETQRASDMGLIAKIQATLNKVPSDAE